MPRLITSRRLKKDAQLAIEHGGASAPIDYASCLKNKMVMKSIATLGPPGTFADMATRKYIENISQRHEVKYYASIKLALDSIGSECEVAVLPIENFSEGFILVVLEALAKRELYITHEIRLSVQFSFVSNSKDIGNIEKVFSQFVAKGQCSEFLATLGNVEEVTTQSNIQSLELLKQESRVAGAIVPAHAATDQDFPTVIENVNDYLDNQTRFVAVSLFRTPQHPQHADEYKTSLVVYGDQDYPGLLGDILSSFSSRGINITSLVSRPSGAKFGQYDFFIDAIGHDSISKLKEAIDTVRLKCKIRSLGSYRAASLQNIELKGSDQC